MRGGSPYILLSKGWLSINSTCSMNLFSNSVGTEGLYNNNYKKRYLFSSLCGVCWSGDRRSISKFNFCVDFTNQVIWIASDTQVGSKTRFIRRISAVSNAIQTKIMKQIISLSIFSIAFDMAETRRMNWALNY